jgi:hypothetical protein
MSVSRLSNDLRDAAGQRSTILSRYAGTQQRIMSPPRLGFLS